MPTDFRSRIIISAKSSAEKVFNSTARASGKVTKALGGVAAAGVAAGAAASGAFALSSIQAAGKFQSAIADLSAITGASGKDLEFLSKQARALGGASTFGATAAAEAFKLVASAKPDLLDNAAALSATTQQVILLSEATGNTLAQSANTVGESLNQFAEGADQASRFVNVLAAGAKFGSSEVADTAAALKKAGVAARGAGLDFEETNAAIQVLAGVGIKGAEAGTALRGVFLRLQTQADDKLNPAIVGIDKALENLEAANLSATERVKLFGQENFVAAQSLVDNRLKLAALTETLTGTSTAVEQAEKRQASFEAQLKLAGAAFENLRIEVGEKFLPVATDVIKIVTQIAKEMTTSTEATEDADVAFSDLDETIRTLAAGFEIVETVVLVVGKSLGAVAAAVVSVFEGNFSQIDDILAAAFTDITKTIDEGVDQANEVISKKTPTAIADALGSPQIVDAAQQVGMTIGENLFEGIAIVSDEAATKAAQSSLEQLTARIESIRQGTLTEVEAEVERIESIRSAVFQAKLAGIEDDAALKQILETAEMQHQKTITSLQTKGITDRLSFERATAKAQTKFILGNIQNITQGVANENKTLFRLNQAAAIGNAIVNTAEGITVALKAAPPPFNLALAAITAAAGAAQIAAISSAKFGGGTTPSVAGTAPTLGGQPVTGQVPSALGEPIGEAPSQRIDINIDGLPSSGMVAAETVRELVAGINDQLGDGVNLDVNGGTAGGNAGTTGGSDT